MILNLNSGRRRRSNLPPSPRSGPPMRQLRSGQTPLRFSRTPTRTYSDTLPFSSDLVRPGLTESDLISPKPPPSPGVRPPSPAAFLLLLIMILILLAPVPALGLARFLHSFSCGKHGKTRLNNLCAHWPWQRTQPIRKQVKNRQQVHNFAKSICHFSSIGSAQSRGKVGAA